MTEKTSHVRTKHENGEVELKPEFKKCYFVEYWWNVGQEEVERMVEEEVEVTARDMLQQCPFGGISL